jgi:hypothetical protein
VVYAKKPFGGPQAVLAYLSRYTHRVAISNRRLISADQTSVTFTWKDYRIEGPDRYKTMTLPTHEFIRRFLTHVLPKGLHRIRHYGLFANGNRAANIARARELLAAPYCSKQAETSETAAAAYCRSINRLAVAPPIPSANARCTRARASSPRQVTRNRQNFPFRPFSVTQLRIRNGSSCPATDLHSTRTEPPGWVVFGPSRFAQPGMSHA